MKNLWISAAAFVFVACGMEQPSTVSFFESDLPFELVLDSSLNPDLAPPGPGAGKWNSERPTTTNQFLKGSAQTYLGTAQARETHGPDAVDTFAHYFDNTGEDFTVDVAKLRADVASVGETFTAIEEAVQIWAAAQTMDEFKFTSATAAVSGITKAENENWYLAIAGFSYWVKGEVRSIDGLRTLQLEFHIWDRYDWDPGVVVPIDTPFGTIPIDQDRVGEFHRQGLAQEFDSIGVLTQEFELD